MSGDPFAHSDHSLVNGEVYSLREVIEHALDPSKRIAVVADPDGQTRYLSIQEWTSGIETYISRNSESSPIVTSSSSKAQKLALFRSLFCAHSEPYAHGYWSTKKALRGFVWARLK